MGISEKTVENHLTRALARIGAALATLPPTGELTHSEPSAKRADDTDHGND